MNPKLSTASDDKQPDHSNKRPRLDDELEATATATQRFFSTPELVHLVLLYLSKDRIDLLALGLVSKTLRIQALKSWVRQLDIDVKVAHNHLNFFKAIPTLLEHVRYLRLQHSHHDWNMFGPSSRRPCGCDWHALSELLKMFAGKSNSTGNPPLIDLSVYDSDLLCLPAILCQQVVALNIRHMSHSNYLAETSSFERSSDGDDGAQLKSQLPRLTSERIADIIHGARQGPGLRSFGLWDHSDNLELSYTTMQQILQRVGQHASTLRYLGIDLECWDPSVKLPCSAFIQLEELCLDGDLQAPFIEELLDGAKNLQTLVITASDAKTLSLRQTFPRLRHVDISGLQLGKDKQKNFATRHPGVVSLLNERSLKLELSAALTSPSDTSVPVFFPKLAHIYASSLAELQSHLNAGRTFAVSTLPPKAEMEHCVALLHSSPAAAQRLTFLELEVFWQSWHSKHFSLSGLSLMLSFQYLPNLAELHLSIQDHIQAVGDSSLEADIGRVTAALTSAQSLKVLQLCGLNQFMQHKDILYDHEFPSALEYFFLQEYNDGNEPQYFRFVSSDPEAHIVTMESGGKRGRLQRIPRTFRDRVTAEGVWRHPLHMSRMGTVLDHLSDAPRLSLS
ncbi:hypothetical protein OC846_006627 [Tilletia horrida]|uniref:F-box domain-containing protein n=1 Tax=Tilletia horrida TaxID=155126 RepID=A0AAN6GLA7_9BASI|nr:hypothetical protein OC846_006627 [Tilletia horrida]KAK0559448.1 hypothetical protein OC861_006643 [Tilletia horrida]